MFNECNDLSLKGYRAARTVHGDLGVEVEIFGNHLTNIAHRYLGSGVADDALVEFIGKLHTNDLFLSLACALGSDAGWKRFGSLYRKYLADLCYHLLGRGSDREDFGQALWADLFLPDRSGQSRIASYDGRSSLSTWLRAVVSNRIVNERQRKSYSLSNLECIPEPVDPAALRNVEARLARDRYSMMILCAFERAAGALTRRERLILLLRYDQGMPLGEMARLCSVHQSTITRQLERIVNRLRYDVVSLLGSEYGLNQAAIEECLSVACDTFSSSISILPLLRDGISSSENISAIGSQEEEPVTLDPPGPTVIPLPQIGCRELAP